MKTALVLGAGGFIGDALVTRLKSEGVWVRGVDLKHPEFGTSDADDFVIADLRNPDACLPLFKTGMDEVYQLAADMGGAGYLFTGENDAQVMQNSARINLNVLDATRRNECGRIFFSSSACIYPTENQVDPLNPICEEATAYPADPDSEYGWEKLFSERMYLAFHRNDGLICRIARYHNIFGPMSTWRGGREKAPAALCRKVAEAPDGGSVEVWGPGTQTRSFLYIDECLEGTLRLMRSDWTGPVNIGSDEMISLNDLARMIVEISGKSLEVDNVPGPVGVNGRCSDNRLIRERLGWAPSRPLRDGIAATYGWVSGQVAAAAADAGPGAVAAKA